MTRYDKQEIRGREIVTDYLLKSYLHIYNPDYIYPTETKNPVDIYFTATTINNREVPYVAEIKEREYYLADPKNEITTWMLETYKLDALMKRKNHRPLYINFFKNDIFLVWDLKKIDFSELEIKRKELKKTTLEDTGKKIKIYYDLPSDQATLIRY